MSEFDTHEPAAGHNPLTRLKFERYMFFAFFAVMVMVVIAGIVEIKRSQQALEESQEQAVRLREAANKAAQRADRERSELGANLDEVREKQSAAEEREARRSRDLGAALTQLAMSESDQGPAARARARQLLDEAARVGAPPYLDLARWSLLDASRPGPAPIERTPFTCAAVSPDGGLLAIGRGERGIDIVEIASGRKLAGFANPEAAGEATALAFAPGALMCGYRGGQLAKAVLGIENPTSAVSVFAKMSAPVKLLSVSTLGRQFVATDASEGMRAGSTEHPERALVAFQSKATLLDALATDSPEKPALTMDTSGQILRWMADGRTEEIAHGPFHMGPCSKGILALEDEFISWAWYAPQGRDLCATTRGSNLWLHEVDEPSCMSFAIDGTLLVGDKAGRLHELWTQEDNLSKGVAMGSETALRFVARAENSVVGIAADGTVSVRFDLDSAQNGRRLMRVGGVTYVSTHGFANTYRGLVWPLGSTAWMPTGPCTRLFATPSGFAAFSNGQARLDSGATAKAEFMICALTSGAALLRSVTGDISLLSRDGKSLPLPQVSRLAPDYVCVAAQSDVVLARTGNTALVIRLENGVTSREIFAPGMPMLGAIDEHGRRVALPDRDSIRILALDGTGEALAYPRGELKALAFLFDGSILCALEGKELAFYDSGSGRELLRRPTSAHFMSGAMDRLFLVCPDELRELRLR